MGSLHKNNLCILLASSFLRFDCVIHNFFPPECINFCATSLIEQTKLDKQKEKERKMVAVVKGIVALMMTFVPDGEGPVCLISHSVRWAAQALSTRGKV